MSFQSEIPVTTGWRLPRLLSCRLHSPGTVSLTGKSGREKRSALPAVSIRPLPPTRPSFQIFIPAQIRRSCQIVLGFHIVTLAVTEGRLLTALIRFDLIR